MKRNELEKLRKSFPVLLKVRCVAMFTQIDVPLASPSAENFAAKPSNDLKRGKEVAAR